MQLQNMNVKQHSHTGFSLLVNRLAIVRDGRIGYLVVSALDYEGGSCRFGSSSGLWLQKLSFPSSSFPEKGRVFPCHRKKFTQKKNKKKLKVFLWQSRIIHKQKINFYLQWAELRNRLNSCSWTMQFFSALRFEALVFTNTDIFFFCFFVFVFHYFCPFFLSSFSVCDLSYKQSSTVD